MNLTEAEILEIEYEKFINDKKIKVIQLNLQCHKIVHDIWDCDESIIQLNEFNKVFYHKIKELQKSIYLVDDLSNKGVKSSTFSELKQFVKTQQQFYKHIKCKARKANISSVNAIYTKSKDLLLESNRKKAEVLKKRRKKDQNQTLETALKVTNDLNIVNRRIIENIKQSNAYLESLEVRTEIRKGIYKEQQKQANQINIGNRLLLKKDRRETTSKLLFFLALILFCFVVIFILNSRITILSLNFKASVYNFTGT